jgi:hypothetical protein
MCLDKKGGDGKRMPVTNLTETCSGNIFWPVATSIAFRSVLLSNNLLVTFK